MTAMANKEFTGRHLLIILISFFGVMLAVNAVFIYLALSTFSGLERPSAYQDGLKYNETIEEARAQDALGWSHKVALSPVGRIELTVTGASGEPVPGLAVSGRIERPVATDTRRELVLSEVREGVYAADADGIGPGNWILTLSAAKARPGGKDAVYRLKERLWLKPN
jgi:nitrogen fixation protein FixH